MKLKYFILCLLFFSSISTTLKADGLEQCFSFAPSTEEFLRCVSEMSIDLEEEEYDCSVLRNYRDENGNFTCPVKDFDTCLKVYGPRLPGSYFPFVKHWCWCNCVYDPDDINN